MKKFLLLTALAAMAANVFAQACTPDQSVAGQGPGVYPLPPSDNDPATTDIYHIQAEVGSPFSFVFTANVPDSLTTGLTLDLTTIAITNIAGFPAGIQQTGVYSPGGVSDTDNIFDDQTIGCLVVGGTPTTVGSYPLTISVLVNSALPLAIPSSAFRYQYVIDVNATNTNSLNGGNITLKEVQPNPASTTANIVISSTETADLNLTVVDALGKVVESRNVSVYSGETVVSLDVTNYASGMYFYSISNGQGVVTKRMVVTK